MSVATTTQGTTPIGPFVRAQLLVRLRDALDLAEHDLASALPRFRELIRDVLERADAISLPADTQADRPKSRFLIATQAATQDTPVTEFLLIPYGEVVVERPIAGSNFVFTRQHAEAALHWFAQMGRKLAIDYEHQSFECLNSRCDGLRPAAGWIGGLELRDDGLWATDVTWTARAAELLAKGEYRYFSPVIFWTDEDQSNVAALGPVALTNDPAMHGVSALAAGSAHEDVGPSTAERRLDAAIMKIAALQRRLAEQDADIFIERGLQSGKIIAATRDDWHSDFLRDPHGTRDRLERAPVLLSHERLTDPELATPTTPPRDGIEPADLAAYEQARATGRIRGSVA